MSASTYRLTLSEQQTAIVCRALEFYERVGGMGQIEEVLDPWRFRCQDGAVEHARAALDEAKLHLTGFDRCSSFGIHSEKVPDEYRVAYDLQQVIRHRMAWDRTPEGGFGVWFDKPHQTSRSPLAAIERIKQTPDVEALLLHVSQTLQDVPKTDRTAAASKLRELADKLAPPKCARCFGCGTVQQAGTYQTCPDCAGGGRHAGDLPTHVSACAGLGPLCGSDSEHCWDGTVSVAYEDGRDITCLPCRAIWLAESRAGRAESRANAHETQSRNKNNQNLF